MYATCDVLHSGVDVFDRLGMMTYILDVMADRMGYKSDIELCCHTHNLCDIICSGYDVINIVGALTYKQWYEVIKSGCDVIYSASGVIHAVGMISYIHRV